MSDDFDVVCIGSGIAAARPVLKLTPSGRSPTPIQVGPIRSPIASTMILPRRSMPFGVTRGIPVPPKMRSAAASPDPTRIATSGSPSATDTPSRSRSASPSSAASAACTYPVAPHLAVATNAGQLKVGAFSRSERMVKWNEVLRIARDLGPHARFEGAGLFRRHGIQFASTPDDHRPQQSFRIHP